MSTDHPRIAALLGAIRDDRQKVVDHRLYSMLDTRAAIITFAEHHVYAVWDFMTLLTSLQRQLTCVDLPWTPKGSPAARRLINEIVLAEESDAYGGGHLSHFELYLRAMADAGADTSRAEQLVDLVRQGAPAAAAMQVVGAPQPAVDFVASTWRFVFRAPIHSQAAAFAFGREGIIPEMFEQVAAVARDEPGLGTLVDYLDRHIDLDGGEHSPMAMRMLTELCGEDDRWWEVATDAALTSVRARAALWDGICEAILARSAAPAASR
jgi:Protein of unknown function (DUF3050)